jgi:hypothetical protein
VSPRTRKVLPTIEPIVPVAGTPLLNDPQWVYEPLEPPVPRAFHRNLVDAAVAEAEFPWIRSSSTSSGGSRSASRCFSRPGRPDARELFAQTVERLLQLRDRGLVRFPEGRIARNEQGAYLMVGPCDLTEAGRRPRADDRRLGPRPPPAS